MSTADIEVAESQTLWGKVLPAPPDESQFILWHELHDAKTVRRGILQAASKYRAMECKMPLDRLVRFASAVMNGIEKERTSITTTQQQQPQRRQTVPAQMFALQLSSNKSQEEMSSIEKSVKKEKLNIAGIYSRSERETELSIVFAKVLDTYCLIRQSIEQSPISAISYDETENSRPLAWQKRVEYVTDTEHAASDALNDLPELHDTFDGIVTEAQSGDIDKTIKLEERSKIVLKVGAIWRHRGLLPRLYFKHIRRRQGEQL